MGKNFKIVDGDISDGFHTFDELYEHRCLLYLNLCLKDPTNCYWKQDYEGWFCLYWESPQGQISYHLPNKFKDVAEKNFKHDPNHLFDGHDGELVLARLELEAVKGQA
ncbi:MAG TPA: hypothetical protein VGD26_12645 [Chitinophagaceae bacterium]